MKKQERVVFGKNGLASSPYSTTTITPQRTGVENVAAQLAADPGLLICQHEHRTHYLGAGGPGGEGGIFVCFACWLTLLLAPRRRLP